MPKPTIGLVGNPNCGKTTLFNALTGANQRVGNWPGVTVERKAGNYRYQGKEIVVVDLPGVYSLDAEDAATGLDELVARDYLLSSEANIIVNIVDATNLERNLYLTTQILEIGVPLLIALNMMDVAKERDIRIDSTALAERLGCPVIPISAVSGQGVPKLKTCISARLDDPVVPTAHVTYPAAIEEAITTLIPVLEQTNLTRSINPRWTTLKLLSDETGSAPELQIAEVTQQVVVQRQYIQAELEEDVDLIVADSRYDFIHHLTQGVAESNRQVKANLSDKIDQVVLSRWWGIPIFLMVMYLMFTVAINVGGAFIDFFDIGFATIFVDGVAHLLAGLKAPGWLVGLLANGVGDGIRTTATFIPQIAMLFIFLSALEDSGYMARAAFVMDRLMRFVGLPGKSFVPMLVGFGCNIPGVMATRTLENKRDRFMTIMMNPFMSCSARLTVYALFCAAFFQVGGQNMVMGLYLLGILAAIFTGLVLKNTILPGEVAPFVMELPPYHIPRLRSVLLRAWERTKAFITKAGRAIVIMVVILGFLNSVGTDGSFGKQNSTDSILSAMSRTVTPIFTPMGITQENWPATVGLTSGIFAKEVMVGTLNSLYGQLAQEKADTAAKPEEPYSFWGGIGKAFTSIPTDLGALPSKLLDPLGLSVTNVANKSAAQLAEAQGVSVSTFGQMSQRFGTRTAAFAYLLFVLLYFPCVSATAAVYRETNLGWTVFIGCWTTGMAYWVAVGYYQMATFAQHPISSLAWLVVLAGVLAATLFGLKLASPDIRRRRASVKAG
ncbi:MAG: Fe(2+) transporter permease subunit FeoB [Chroococcidiopsidaceae cyanobacterium CP_BM_RX_35]|nr:Fe(2+) transporter permease subunit FeoB [Chroococcidiopsidaceae cyanobacterium CP_BM_RX_35]